MNRYVYGWFPRGDILNSKCIVLIGHDPRRHSWTMEYKAIRMAQAQGAKLIVLDPRRSENAERADVWLPLRAGTDAGDDPRLAQRHRRGGALRQGVRARLDGRLRRAGRAP